MKHPVVISRRSVLGAGLAIASAAALPLLPDLAQAQESRTSTRPATPKRVVFIASNQVMSPTAGFPVGYYLPELAHPYWAFAQKGFHIDIASPEGGKIIHDEMSDPEGGRFGNPNDFLSVGFKRSAKIAPLLEATKPLAAVRAADYDAIFVVGGLGPMMTFIDNSALHTLFAQFYESGKVSATICHGSCILLKTKLSSGKLLAEGKQWTGFCDNEEIVVDKTYNKKVQPFRIEEEAKKIPGTRFVQGPAWRPFAVADGRLISGQQGNSGALTAELVIKALEA